MKIAVTYPDIEIATREVLTDLLADRGEIATVSIGVPPDWTPASTPHVEVAWDGTPVTERFIYIIGTMRIVARAGSPSEAKRLCTLAYGLLCGPIDHPDINTIEGLTGPLTARDPETLAEIASCTVAVQGLSAPIVTGS